MATTTTKLKRSSSLQSIKSQKAILNTNTNFFHFLSDELIFIVLDFLTPNPIDRKSFSLVCKSFYSLESKHRRTLTPLRSEHLPTILTRYPSVTRVDLTLCPRITDASLITISNACKSNLQSIDLSRSKNFSGAGLQSLALNCKNMVEIDLSNATELRDSGAAALAEAKNLERLWLGRCKMITDMGVGCIAVGCRKMKLISLKWCLGVGDLGIELLALKCKDLQSLDLSYLPITEKCLPSIFKLPHLEDLVLEGCFGIDDDSLAALKHGCKSLKKLDISSCQNISHNGLASLTSDGVLEQLVLSHGSPVTLALADSLKKLPMLQSIKLDGCSITYAGLQAIGNWCVSLRELSLSKCPGVTDEGLSSLLTKHKDLRKLDITCCRMITYTSIDRITLSCTALTSLRMESCTLVPREAFVLIGQRCRFLEEIDITDNEVDDEGLKSISRCSELSSLKLGICLNITDEGVAQVGMCCSKLVELDLYRCTGISDSGISAIARGCPGLKMINIAYCKDITDSSLISLSKCSSLNTVESRGCPLITSLGLAAIAVGCKQLVKLDIKKCINIDDAGMIPLAHFSQNLRQINLSYTSVTDVGLLSLASISCLQSLTILHLKGLTASGLAAALLACGGLTKVKLQATFKSLLPQALFEHLEARGCLFLWRDKFFRAELDPQCWKLQLEDNIL
ncbi:putative F-box domain, leucine-rich repeat domain, L domain-containing protein [Rosa chinensis]|uniref:Putative F-box domain, leucine-rich repeat domain, L domain-containing protein n=1 Tax=Rosa chinensis TaxID=74649 RepID=A0A2P6R8L6_ROSCH|nr:F-box/LRR-repeat protein 3 [Rosa chinensis]PRQ42788.1 putative F-box domain, leucine-rich repeat domain, L domain-containing protein [Rosa chinensis]